MGRGVFPASRPRSSHRVAAGMVNVMKNALVSFSAALLLAVAFVLAPPQTAQAVDLNHSCDFCHGSHGARGRSIIKSRTIEGLCLSCHGTGGRSRLKVDRHFKRGAARYLLYRQSCTECHSLHGEPSFGSEFGFKSKKRRSPWRRK